MSVAELSCQFVHPGGSRSTFKKACVKHFRGRNFFKFFAVFPTLMYTNDFETLLCCFHLCTRLKFKFLAAEFDIFLSD